MLFFSSQLILGQAGGGGGNPLTNPVSLLFFAAMFGVMYLIMIRPQQKQLQAHKAMLAGLVKGDEVITKSGMIGKINAITDRVVTLEVASGVKVRMLKDFIDRKWSPAAESAQSAKADKDKADKSDKDKDKAEEAKKAEEPKEGK
ncbi:MAG TPA: preprotein translocase subunit YajC [Myxococcales bacterium]|nr:preprotein translocase subunit YajC [Myxococcales bacterium]